MKRLTTIVAVVLLNICGFGLRATMVQSLQPLTPAQIPECGTFYSMQNTNWPPLPSLDAFPDTNLTVYSMGYEFPNSYAVDDLDVAYPPMPTDIQTTMFSMDLPSPPDSGGDDSGGGSGTNFSQSVNIYGSNVLWLEITGVTNNTANLVIHPPWNAANRVYDLLYCTNLAPPISWQWLLRSDPGQTNLLVPNVTDAQGFYRLSAPNDLAANDSLGTNFWLAFPCMYYGPFNNHMSLYISSPVGAGGTVTTPGLMTNGPVLIVTNCGDATVDGTYVLTNLTAQEQAAWEINGLAATDVSYENGTNWVVFDSSTWWMFGYDGAYPVTFMYYKDGGNLNGSNTDWYSCGDTNLPTPTTICAQVPFSQTFTVAAGAVTNISIPPAVMMKDYDVAETNGIHITAGQPVSVYGLEYYPCASAAFTGYPTQLLGTNYCVMARASLIPSDINGTCYSELAIVATADNTTVHITPSATANLAGTLWSNPFTLQQGQTYQISSSNYTGDVTGTRISSDKPVGVFAGASLAYVPDTNTQAGNPLAQEQLPVDSWGTQVLALAFAGRQYGDLYRVLAAYSNTVVTITTTNGVLLVTNLDAGGVCETNLGGPVEFQASKPIQVAKFANGSTFSGEPGDPCEILLPPTSHYLVTNIVFTLPNYGITGDFDENYLNLIVPQSATNSTWVDDSIVAATNFVAIGTNGYFGAQLTVTNSGAHTVTSSQPVGVEVYGFGTDDAYSYFGGVVK